MTSCENQAALYQSLPTFLVVHQARSPGGSVLAPPAALAAEGSSILGLPPGTPAPWSLSTCFRSPFLAIYSSISFSAAFLIWSFGQ